jgi:hypothetical protein
MGDAASSFLRNGLPITVELDEPAGLVARVEAVPNHGAGWRTVARATATVAVRGRVALR